MGISSPGFAISLAALAPDAAAGPITLFALVCGLSLGGLFAAVMFHLWASQGAL